MSVHHSYLAAYSYILEGAVTESYHCLYNNNNNIYLTAIGSSPGGSVKSNYRFHKNKICLRSAELNLATFVIFYVKVMPTKLLQSQLLG
jgi:hypothetical protein